MFYLDGRGWPRQVDGRTDGRIGRKEGRRRTDERRKEAAWRVDESTMKMLYLNQRRKNVLPLLPRVP